MKNASSPLKQYQLIRQTLTGEMLVNEPLSKHTSFKIGGPADVYYSPPDLDNLTAALDLCRKEGIHRLVIGNGSNLLVSDEGFRGMVIDLSRGFNRMSSKGSAVMVEAGTLLQDVLTFLTERGLSGMERLIGIPGRVGGCIRLNAGAFGTEMGDRLRSIQLLRNDGTSAHLDRSMISMSYRHTDFMPEDIILEASFVLDDGNPKEMARVQQEILSKRKEKQPLSLPSAGSVFKRPQGDFAGRLIDEAGCKGLRIGDAMISKKHANFIVNVHFATARDVMRLIDEVRDRVVKRFGVMLELEIELIGFSET
jgi:UDP-N-acetylmuramate dehydrogenase